MWNQEDSLSLTMVGVMCLYWEKKTIQEKCMHLFIFHFAKQLFKNLNKKNSNNVWEREQDLWRKQKLLEKGERGLIYFLLAAYWIMTIIIITIHTPSQLFDLHHIPHNCHFFTLTQFSENKIYTKIYTVNCQFTQ